MTNIVSVQIAGKAFVGTLRPADATADAELRARYRLDRDGFPTCRGPHVWDEVPPEANRVPGDMKCSACGRMKYTWEA